MTTVSTNNSSAGDAIVSLLRSSSNASANAASSAIPNADPSSKGGGNPAVVVDLSDRAKALLEKNKTDQVAAGRLQTLVQNLRDQNGGETGKSAGSATAGSADPKDLNGYLASLFEANKKPDGTYGSFTKSVSDVLDVPSTPQQVDDWYKSEGQAVSAGAKDFTNADYQVYAQAVLNRTVTIQSAKDIPGLSFHNTIIFQGGEGGGSAGYQASYNQDAAIFKDPTTAYAISDNGTVISWKKSQPST
jgi:hypothetical protein